MSASTVKKHTVVIPEKEQIIDGIVAAFSGWSGFHHYVADKLEAIVQDAHGSIVDSIFLKCAVKRYFKILPPPTSAADKVRLAEAKIVLMGCYVYILMLQEESQYLKWTSVKDLIAEFPHLMHLPEEEQQLLVGFRNAVRVTMELIPGERNKKTIMQIAGRLQGEPRDYITGGGQKEEVTHRIQIFERTTGVTAKSRPVRLNQAPKSHDEGSINATSPSLQSKMEISRTDATRQNLVPDASGVQVASCAYVLPPTEHLSLVPSAGCIYANTQTVELDDAAFMEAIEAISSDDTLWQPTHPRPLHCRYTQVEELSSEDDSSSPKLKGSGADVHSSSITKRKFHLVEDSICN